MSVKYADTAYSEQRRKLKNRTLAILYGTYACFYLSRKADSVVKSNLHEHGFSVEELAISDTVYLSVYTVFLGLSGVIGNYVPSNVLLATGLFCLALTSFLKAQVTSPMAFAACQVLHAIFQSFGWPTCIKLVGIFVTENRGFVMGVWTTCQSLGGILGAILATMMVSRGGWQAAYLYHVPIMIVMGIIVYLFITDDAEGGRPPKEQVKRSNDPEAQSLKKSDDKPAEDSEPVSLRAVLSIPGVLPIGVAYFFLKFLRYALLMWLPYYYDEGLHFAQETAGYMSSSFELGGMIGTPLIGYVSDKVFSGRRDLTSAIFLFGASVMLVSCVTFAQYGVAINAFNMFCVGLLVIGPDSVLSGTIAQDLGSSSSMGPKVIGTLAGLINSIGSCGSIFQSYATAYISGAYGWNVLFCVFIVCSLLSCFILMQVAFGHGGFPMHLLGVTTVKGRRGSMALVAIVFIFLLRSLSGTLLA